MFQNISYQEINKESKNKKSIKNIVKNLFTIQNLILCILSFMISTVSILDGMTIFGMAVFAAACSNGMSVVLIYVATLIGTYVGQGTEEFITYLIMSLFFLVSIKLVKPRMQEDYKNEKLLLGKNIIFSIIILKSLSLFTGNFIISDLIATVTQALLTYIFYKIFVNSLSAIRDVFTHKAFTLEEVVGAGLFVTIAISSLSNINIYGVNLSNVISILIILLLGWQNGALVGTTTGLSIGVVLAIIGVGDTNLIATYALSGLVAGILNRFGKIGVIAGFACGIGVLAYLIKSNIEPFVYLKELLVASIVLFLVPKTFELNLKDIFIKDKFISGRNGNILAAGRETKVKLDGVSEAIAEMAKNYEEAAATIVDEKEDLISKNRNIFIEDALTNLEAISENMLYKDLISVENGILVDIFTILVEKEEIEKADLISVFEKHNCYIVIPEERNEIVELDKYLFQAIKNLNYSYKISKVNFVWKHKEMAEKKDFSNKLNSVSQVISNIADEMPNANLNEVNIVNKIEKNLIAKGIKVKDLQIEHLNNGKYLIKCIFENNNKNIVAVEEILSNELNSTIKYSGNEEQYLKFESEDKFKLELGISCTNKYNSEVSGDCSIQTKLKDGKILLAISDGMGSGLNARKSSSKVIKMLEQLLSSGFKKETSIELINNTLTGTLEGDMYATLDAAILDLYAGKIELIKNGACKTYLKNKNTVRALQESSIPVGIANGMTSYTYENNIKKDDIIVMFSDGIINSTNSDWLYNMLIKISTENVQKIADIIINEALDENFGKADDDMTIIVAKIK